MIDKKFGGAYEVFCDFCDHVEEIDTDGDFQELLDQMKENGWENFKDEDGEWEHKCPICVENDKKEKDN